jgi:hypothetical protein
MSSAGASRGGGERENGAQGYIGALFRASRPRHNRIPSLWKRLKVNVYGSRTCKPNSVRLAAGRSFLWATHYCGAQATYPEVVAHRAGTRPAEAGFPPYLVLLRVGFALPGALLRRRCALTAPFHPYLGLTARAVCFLWHFPSNGPASTSAGALPDVIRHTALRSSDFPPVLTTPSRQKRARWGPRCDERPSGPAANQFIIVQADGAGRGCPDTARPSARSLTPPLWAQG